MKAGADLAGVPEWSSGLVKCKSRFHDVEHSAIVLLAGEFNETGGNLHSFLERPASA